MSTHYRFKLSYAVESIPLCVSDQETRSVHDSIIYKPVRRDGKPITDLCPECVEIATAEGIPEEIAALAALALERNGWSTLVGDGSDGDLRITPGMRLDRDTNAKNAVLEAGADLATILNGYQLRIQGTLTLEPGATISLPNKDDRD